MTTGTGDFAPAARASTVALQRQLLAWRQDQRGSIAIQTASRLEEGALGAQILAQTTAAIMTATAGHLIAESRAHRRQVSDVAPSHRQSLRTILDVSPGRPDLTPLQRETGVGSNSTGSYVAAEGRWHRVVTKWAHALAERDQMPHLQRQAQQLRAGAKTFREEANGTRKQAEHERVYARQRALDAEADLEAESAAASVPPWKRLSLWWGHRRSRREIRAKLDNEIARAASIDDQAAMLDQRARADVEQARAVDTQVTGALQQADRLAVEAGELLVGHLPATASIRATAVRLAIQNQVRRWKQEALSGL